jgi:antitoxin (DNA-binding transcriptional repressor) of toxin-antitoxin stability system
MLQMRTTTTATKKKIAASTKASRKAARPASKPASKTKTKMKKTAASASARSGSSRSTKKTPSSAKAEHPATPDQAVSSRELKANLGRYLKRVRNGETFLVTDRGTAIAELRPPATGERKVSEALKRMAARGEVTLGSGEPLGDIEPIKLKGKGNRASEIILEEREDRF